MMDENLQYFLLILIRIASFIWISPGFSFKGMPQMAKLALSLGLSVAVFGMVPIPFETLSLEMYVLIILKEVLVGVAIGYITQLFFSGIEMAGSFADFQVGFSMSMAYDPILGVNTSYYGRVYYWIAMAVFFLANIHHQVIRTLVQSFEYLPVTQLSFSHMGVEGIVRTFSYVFEIALNLAFPLIIVALLAEIILALLSRTVPQINVLILGMPFKILLSVIFLFFFLPFLHEGISKVFPDMLKYLQEFIQSLAN